MKTALVIAVISIFWFSASGSRADAPAGFDSSDEGARFDTVTASVGGIQDAKSFQFVDGIVKKHEKIKTDYLDQIPAIGLSRNEIKNLKTYAGQLLEVEANGVKISASVYKTKGEDAPPPGTINLSVAAAKKLGVKEGDKITVSHRDDEVSLPIISRKMTSLEQVD